MREDDRDAPAPFSLASHRASPLEQSSVSAVSQADEIRFPEGRLWGGATGAHQVEGGNIASDVCCSSIRKNTIFQQPSGDACDFLSPLPKRRRDGRRSWP